MQVSEVLSSLFRLSGSLTKGRVLGTLGGYHQYIRRYHEYTGDTLNTLGCSVHQRDIMSTLGDTMIDLRELIEKFILKTLMYSGYPNT